MTVPVDPLTARQMANAARRQMDVTAARLRDQLGPDEVLARLSSAAARKGQHFAADIATRAATSKPALIAALLIGIGLVLKKWGVGTRTGSTRLDRKGKDEQ